MKAAQLVNDLLRDYLSCRKFEYVGSDNDPLAVIRIYTRIPDDPNKSSNGGDYYFWTDYRQVGQSVRATEGSSCELPMDLDEYWYSYSTLCYAFDIAFIEDMRNAWAEVSLDSIPSSGPWAEDDFVSNLTRSVRAKWIEER